MRPIRIILSENKVDKTAGAVKRAIRTSGIGMEGRVVEMLGMPQLVFSLDIGNRSTRLVIFDDSCGTIQGLFSGENILRNKSLAKIDRDNLSISPADSLR